MAVKAINNAAAEIALRPNVALLTLPSINTLAEEVAASSLAFSLIRMHYAAV